MRIRWPCPHFRHHSSNYACSIQCRIHRQIAAELELIKHKREGSSPVSPPLPTPLVIAHLTIRIMMYLVGDQFRSVYISISSIPLHTYKTPSCMFDCIIVHVHIIWTYMTWCMHVSYSKSSLGRVRNSNRLYTGAQNNTHYCNSKHTWGIQGIKSLWFCFHSVQWNHSHMQAIKFSILSLAICSFQKATHAMGGYKRVKIIIIILT